jgi:hypothetical protein
VLLNLIGHFRQARRARRRKYLVAIATRYAIRETRLLQPFARVFRGTLGRTQLISILSRRHLQAPQANPTQQRFIDVRQKTLVTVVIPFRDAAATLPETLHSLDAQSYPHYEVIVVDDASTLDQHRAAAALVADRSGTRLIRLDTRGGPYVARNATIATARGELIMSNDADDIAHQDLLADAVAAHMQPGVRAYLAYRNSTGPSTVPMTQIDFSSLTVRTADLRAFGGWLPIKVGADSEMIRRIELLFGLDAFRFGDPKRPLRTVRRSSSTLTTTAESALSHASLRRTGGARNILYQLVEFAGATGAARVHPTILPRILQTDCPHWVTCDCPIYAEALVTGHPDRRRTVRTLEQSLAAPGASVIGLRPVADERLRLFRADLLSLVLQGRVRLVSDGEWGGVCPRFG